MEITDAVFSIRPRFAHLIFGCTKKHELRRRRPALLPGFIICVYVTKPVQAIVGHFAVGEVLSGPPKHIWSLVAQTCGLDQEAFRNYFTNCMQSHAISVRDPVLWPQPLTLAEIREVDPGFHPPQQYSFLRRHGRLQVALRSRLATYGE